MRGPKKYYSIRDSYKIYKKLSKSPVGISLFLSICNSYMKFLAGKLLSSGEVPVPERLGKLSILGRKIKVRVENGEIKGLAPDWVNTKKLWEQDEEAKAKKQLVFHFNEETNGVRYKFLWGKSRVLVANKTLYNFRLTRHNKRTLSKMVQEGKEYLIKN